MSYEEARKKYAQRGVDTDAAIGKLKQVPVSLHCWQGDDVRGFDTDPSKPLTGGIQTTGNYPGRARNIDEVRNDVLFAKITPCMENGKGAVAKGLCNEIGFGSTEFHVLRPIKEVSNPYWLYAITSFEMFRREAARKMVAAQMAKKNALAEKLRKEPRPEFA